MTDEEKQLHIRIPRDVYTKLKIKCAYQGISIQDYLSNMIQQGMNGKAERRSLLIVDDEPIVRDALVDSIKETHDVTAVGSAEEALELLAKQDFDIVITDMRLPGKSGVELVREIKELKPYVVSVVITAYPSVELAVEAMKQGAVDYLVKPVSVDDLARVLERFGKRKEERGASASDLTAEVA
jgi:DNA-binding NtrC family response regulator